LRYFEAGMHARAQARRIIELDMRAAVRNGEFELNYQPIVQVESGEVTAFEALVRWRHPQRGMISPADFIPLAESTGLIVPLGEWILRKACSDAASWSSDSGLDRGYSEGRSANFAAAQYRKVPYPDPKPHSIRPPGRAGIRGCDTLVGAEPFDARGIRLSPEEGARHGRYQPNGHDRAV
jgi:hypothetical protein